MKKNNSLFEEIFRNKKLMGLNEATNPPILFLNKIFKSISSSEIDEISQGVAKKLGKRINNSTDIVNAVKRNEINEYDVVNIIGDVFKRSGKNLDVITDTLISGDKKFFSGVKTLVDDGASVDEILRYFPELNRISEDLRNHYLNKAGLKQVTFLNKPKPTNVNTPTSANVGIKTKTINDIIGGKYTIGDASELSVDEITKLESVVKLGGVAKQLKNDDTIRKLEIAAKRRKENHEELMSDAEFNQYVNEIKHKKGMNDIETERALKDLEQKTKMDNLDYKEKKSNVTVTTTANQTIILKNRLRYIGLWSIIVLGVVGTAALTYYLTNKNKKKVTTPTNRPPLSSYEN